MLLRHCIFKNNYKFLYALICVNDSKEMNDIFTNFMYGPEEPSSAVIDFYLRPIFCSSNSGFWSKDLSYVLYVSFQSLMNFIASTVLFMVKIGSLQL